MEDKVKQIPLKIRDINELKAVLDICKIKHYQILHGLEKLNDIKNLVAVVIDTRDKEVFSSNITCMACWSANEKRPLYGYELVDNFVRLCIDRNLSLYNQILEKAKLDTNRPIGGLYKI